MPLSTSNFLFYLKSKTNWVIRTCKGYRTPSAKREVHILCEPRWSYRVPSKFRAKRAMRMRPLIFFLCNHKIVGAFLLKVKKWNVSKKMIKYLFMRLDVYVLIAWDPVKSWHQWFVHDAKSTNRWGRANEAGRKWAIKENNSGGGHIVFSVYTVHGYISRDTNYVTLKPILPK